MKKKSLLTIAIVAVCLLALLTGALRLRRHYLPLDGPTCALYEKYKDSPGIKASYLRDYPINDTLAVDVTTLQATSDSAWCALLLDFGASEDLIDMYKTDKESLVGENICSFFKFNIDKNNIKKRLPKSNPDSRRVIGSYAKRSLCIFMTDKKAEQENISLNELKKLKDEN